MAPRTTFANLSAGNQPASLIDQMFADFANWIVIPCTAAGANNIVLIPMSVGGGGIPAIPSYGYQTVFSFIAAANSTAPLYAQYGTLPQLPVYLGDGVTQAGQGQGAIVQGQPYWVQYNAALNSGGGGFYLLSPAVSLAPSPKFTPSLANSVFITNGPSPNSDTQWGISVGAATFSTLAGTGNIRRINISVMGSILTTGLNGIDTGTPAANMWYYVWVIDNGITSGTLLSLSSTSPLLPSGYVYAMRLGAMFIDSGLHLLKTIQVGNRATYVVTPSTNTPALPKIASGSAGSVNTPTYVPVRVRNGTTSNTQYIPPTSNTVRLAYTVGGTQSILVAPNGSYNNEGSSNPPPINITFGGSGSVGVGGNSDMVLESDNIYWASSGGASTALYALGWIDQAAVF